MPTPSKTAKKSASPKAPVSVKPSVSTPSVTPSPATQSAVSPAPAPAPAKQVATPVKETVTKKETVPVEKPTSAASAVAPTTTPVTPIASTEKMDTKEVQTVTFYGRTVRKFFDKKWYFAIEDVLSIAKSDDGLKTPPRKANFEDIKKKVTKLIHNDLYADASGCMALMREIDGIFPGSLGRWLNESS